MIQDRHPPALETKSTEEMVPKPTLREVKAENANLKKSIASLQKLLNKTTRQNEMRLGRIRNLVNRISDELATTQEG